MKNYYSIRYDNIHKTPPIHLFSNSIIHWEELFVKFFSKLLLNANKIVRFAQFLFGTKNATIRKNSDVFHPLLNYFTSTVQPKVSSTFPHWMPVSVS